MEQLGAGSRAEGVQALAQSPLELVEAHVRDYPPARRLKG
jgi:hypothetical protein